jgi:pimeloyl-ACP methyl ester carboxylesterase
MTKSSAVDEALANELQWPALKRHAALANGVSLAYVALGPERAPPIVMIHGYTDSSRAFAQFTGHLPGRRLILPDLRGHGASDKGPHLVYGPLDMAMDLVLLLDALGLDSATIVGHSMGGIVAQIMAALYPKRVGKLVLIATTGELVNALEGIRADIVRAEGPFDPDGDFMRILYETTAPVDAGYLGRLRHDAANVPLHVWLGALDAMSITSLEFAARMIACPTLILWGDDDPIFDRGLQERMAARIPGAKLRVFAGCGHNPYWEQPVEFARAITEFLDR